jgi:hypothetical protein
MDGSEILEDLMEGSGMEWRLLNFTFFENTGGYDLEFLVGAGDRAAIDILVSQLKDEAKQEFVVSNTKGQSRYYVCKLSSRNKKGTGKYLTRVSGCPAKLSLLTVESVEESGRRGWGGLQTKARLVSDHNHDIHTASSLRNLSSPRHIMEEFMHMYGNALTPAQALMDFKYRLKQDPAYTDDWLRDGTKFPRSTCVDHWFRWFKVHKWGITDNDKYQKLQSRVLEYSQKGCVLEVAGGGLLAAALVTPLMRRAMAEWWSNEMMFVDATSSCDGDSTTVTIISTIHPGSGITVPLGLILTQGRSEAMLTEGFACFEQALSQLPVKWGGAQGPKAAMTDHDKGEMNAIQATYPGITHYLCTFHISEAVKRKLTSANTGLSKTDQDKLYRLFTEVHKEPDDQLIQQKWTDLLNQCIKLKSQDMHDYFSNHYGGNKKEWMYGYRGCEVRGSHSNNRSESNMLAWKSQVMERSRSHNVVSLADWGWTRLDNIFRERLITFAGGEITRRIRDIRKAIQKLEEKANKIRRRDVIGAPPSLLVRSAHTPGLKFTVDLANGECECFEGGYGMPCKHQYKCAQIFPQFKLHWLRRYTQESRYEAACLAQGTGSVHYSQYADDLNDDGVVALAGPSNAPLPSPFPSPAKSPAHLGPIKGGAVSGPAVKALKLSMDPPTLNQQAYYEDRVDLIGKEMVRMLVERHSGDGFADTAADLDALLGKAKKVKGPGPSRDFFRALPRALFFRPRGRISVNPAAIKRRKTNIRSSRPIVGRIVKPAGLNAARKIVNKARKAKKNVAG